MFSCENANQYRELIIVSEHTTLKGIFTITIPKANEINITYFFKVSNVIKYYTIINLYYIHPMCLFLLTSFKPIYQCLKKP